MKFTFTSFDKAILAAILGPIIAYGTAWLDGSAFDEKTLLAAVVAGVVAGLGVYFKGNAPSQPSPNV